MKTLTACLLVLAVFTITPSVLAKPGVTDPRVAAGTSARAADYCLAAGSMPFAPAVALSGPTRTRVIQDAHGLILTIDDRPARITGLNYNVNYTSLPEATRRTLHRRDFQIMQAMGVNAIVGWGVYDEITLEIAQAYGIGVIMPFDLDPQGPFESQSYKDELKSEFAAYIKRFKGFPAVWAWNPGGDELLYRMDTEDHRTTDKLQTAADFLVDLAALANSLDSNHVSVIKEPRDLYVPELDAAIKDWRSHNGGRSPGDFLVFGVNVYGHPDDVAVAIQTAKRNAEQRMEVAFLVTEFGPNQLPPSDRAMYYGAIWDDVRAYSPNGGLAYVFGPDQPDPQYSNPYDPLHLLPNEYSLVDNQGMPIDDALCTLAARFRQAHLDGSIRKE